MNMPNHAFDDATDPTPRAARTNLYLAATLVGEGSRLAVTVRNLSATGALVRSRQVTSTGLTTMYLDRLMALITTEDVVPTALQGHRARFAALWASSHDGPSPEVR